MRRARILLAAVFLMGVLVVPAVTLAASGLGQQPVNHAVPNLVAPPTVAGATVRSASLHDAQAWGGAVAYQSTVNGLLYAVDPGGTDCWLTLDVPSGSTMARIDVYGYRGSSGTLDWDVFDTDGLNALEDAVASGVSPTGGPGVIQTTFTSFVSNTVAAGHTWRVSLHNTSVASKIGIVGVVYQYYPATYTLTPITPVRVYDSRFDSAGKLLNGQKRTVNVKNAINPANGVVIMGSAIPAGAKAISFTVTLTGTVGSGNVAVLPASATPVVTASTINWTTANLDIATGSMVTMGTGTFERQICLALGGSAGAASHVIIDVTGYYM